MTIRRRTGSKIHYYQDRFLGWAPAGTESRPPTTRQLWLAVAAARRRAGDDEGADRARRTAALSVPLRPPPVKRARLDPHRNYRTHWKTWRGMGTGMGPGCGSWAYKLSENPADVDCGNCQRLRNWPTA